MIPKRNVTIADSLQHSYAEYCPLSDILNSQDISGILLFSTGHCIKYSYRVLLSYSIPVADIVMKGFEY
jgi:hypothetical protein